jgi:hypothetical protein
MDMANMIREMGLSAASGPTLQSALTTPENTTQAMPCRTGELCQGIGTRVGVAPHSIATAKAADLRGKLEEVTFAVRSFSGDLGPPNLIEASLGGECQLPVDARQSFRSSELHLEVSETFTLQPVNVRLENFQIGAVSALTLTPQPGVIKEQVALPYNGTAASGTFDTQPP